jgi:hypothetical protein
MNCKQIASMGMLVTVLGFFGLESVEAKTSLSQPSNTVSNPATDAIEPLQTSSYTIAQTFEPSPIYETWKLTHSFDGIVYESILVMNGRSGVMRTKYFNPQTKKTAVVRQSMRLDTVPQGLLLYGSNPVDDKTNKPANYFADNFLISIRPDGPVILQCDDQGACSNVDVEEVK